MGKSSHSRNLRLGNMYAGGGPTLILEQIIPSASWNTKWNSWIKIVKQVSSAFFNMVILLQKAKCIHIFLLSLLAETIGTSCICFFFTVTDGMKLHHQFWWFTAMTKRQHYFWLRLIKIKTLLLDWQSENEWESFNYIPHSQITTNIAV